MGSYIPWVWRWNAIPCVLESGGFNIPWLRDQTTIGREFDILYLRIRYLMGWGSIYYNNCPLVWRKYHKVGFQYTMGRGISIVLE